MKERTHKVLLVGVVRVKQVDETTHEALLLRKVFWVWVISWLVRLVLDQCRYQVQDGVHLQEPEFFCSCNSHLLLQHKRFQRQKSTVRGMGSNNNSQCWAF